MKYFWDRVFPLWIMILESRRIGNRISRAAVGNSVTDCWKVSHFKVFIEIGVGRYLNSKDVKLDPVALPAAQVIFEGRVEKTQRD